MSRAERWLPGVYVLVALSVNVLLCLLTPPFFGPDEPHHAARVLSVSRGEWMAQKKGDEVGADIDSNALRVMDRMDTIREAAEKRSPDFLDRAWGPVGEGAQRQQAGVRWSGSGAFAEFPNTAVYPPTLYLPAGLGWVVGKACHWTIFWSLRLARLFAALTAVGIGWLALRLCACSRWMLFGYLLFPSAVFLNATCSQDAVLLPVAGLIAAVLSRALVEQREFTRMELGGVAALVLLCATARPPYLAMVLVLFLPGVERTGLAWRRWLGPTMAAAGVLSASGAWRHLVYPLGVDIDDGADPGLQMLFLRGHPLTGAWFLIRGTVMAGGDFIRRGGYVVGWNDLLAPIGLRVAAAVCFLALVLAARGCPIRSWRGRWLLSVAVAAPLVGISAAEYLIWTPPGVGLVYGIQPRYWLPMMPLGGMLVQGLLGPVLGRVGRVERWRGGLVLASGAGVIGLTCTLPSLVAHAFYLESVGQVLWVNLR